jgi:hypothetical protein
MRTSLATMAILAASLMMSALAAAPAQRAATPVAPAAALSGVEALDWMAGCWSQPRPDGLTEEHWMKPSGGTMLGMSRTVRRGRTTAYEFLQIRDVGGKLAYVAKPSGQDETPFALKTLADGEVVFENPAHDYPQRIMYRRHTDGTLTARIEGTRQGQVRGVDFPFKRCP